MSSPQQTPRTSNMITQEGLITLREALPDVLKPPPRKQMHLRFRLGYKATESVLPLDVLPPGLRTFRIGRYLQPPMLCYGWPVNVTELVSIAESKGFLGPTTLNKDARPMARIDITDTQHLLRHVIRDDLGISTITADIRNILPKSNSREFILCLSTSWNDIWDTDTQNPPQADVAEITAHLGFEEPPKWYIDFEEGKWAFRTFKSFPVPRKVYKFGLVKYTGVNEDGCFRCKTRPL